MDAATADDVPDGPAVVVAAVRAAPARLGRTRLVSVDGPAGSGKTTTAAQVARLLREGGASVAVVHLDDLYDGWDGLEGSLWPRLAAQVLEPVRRGRPGRFQRYDWPLARFADWVDVPCTDVLVVEGCGSARREVDPLVSVRVWVEAPADVRLARGLARDGDQVLDRWTVWMVDEDAHFRREDTRARADVLLDGAGRLVRPPCGRDGRRGSPPR